MGLVLKRASASRPSGEWNDDDYDVLADGLVVGRIFHVAAAPVGTPWMWTLVFARMRAFALNERLAVWFVKWRYDPWEASEALLRVSNTHCTNTEVPARMPGGRSKKRWISGSPDEMRGRPQGKGATENSRYAS